MFLQIFHPAGPIASHKSSLGTADDPDFAEAVVRITMETDEGTICVGTGSCFNDHRLVTARHLVFDGDDKTFLPLAANGHPLDLEAEIRDLDLAFLIMRYSKFLSSLRDFCTASAWIAHEPFLSPSEDSAKCMGFGQIDGFAAQWALSKSDEILPGFTISHTLLG